VPGLSVKRPDLQALRRPDAAEPEEEPVAIANLALAAMNSYRTRPGFSARVAYAERALWLCREGMVYPAIRASGACLQPRLTKHVLHEGDKSLSAPQGEDVGC
jgi:hypothetical protein